MTADSTRQKFMADHMLGSLARWLRMMGYDCRYEKGLADEELLEISRTEGRILLTRDEELAEKSGGMCLRTTALDEQLREVAAKFGLMFDPSEMRCSLCNGSLERIGKEDAIGKAPERSLKAASDFWRCDSCGKIYWNGTHWNGIIGRFRRLGLVRDDK